MRLVLVLLGHAGRAQATEVVCPADRVQVEGSLEARWLTSLAAFCASLSSLRDLDPSARLRVIPSGQEVILEVTLTDRRSVLRRVRTPEALQLTAEALLVIPPVAPAAPALVSTAVTKPTSPPTRESIEAPAPAPPPHQGQVPEIELGGAIGGRMARSPLYLSAGPSAHAALRLGDWRLGLSVRWDTVLRSPRGPYPNFEMDSVGAGFLVVRQVARASRLALDAGGTALLLAEVQSVQKSREQSDLATDVRLGMLLRASLGEGSWRWQVVLDAEISPTRIRRDLRVGDDFPTLPTWSLGLGTGLLWTGL